MIRLYFWTYFFFIIIIAIVFLLGVLFVLWFFNGEKERYKIDKMIKKYKNINIKNIFFLIEYEIEKYKEITNENPSKIYMTYGLQQLLKAYNRNICFDNEKNTKIFGIPVSIDTEHKGFYYCIGGHDGEIEIEEENDR
jgi:hypothetical protein